MRKLVLSALILASALQTALGEQDGDWTYSVSNGQATITGYAGAGGAVTIPSQLGGYEVIALGNPNPSSGVFSYNTSITSAIIPSGVVSLGLRTFDHCSSLQSVVVPDTVNTIGRNAFGYCTSLITATLPIGLSSIEQETFRDCSALSSIVLPPALASIGDAVFENCSLLSSINIPSTVSYIGEGAFAFTGLQAIDLSNTTANLSFSLFYNCTALSSVKLPLSMEVLRGWTFYGCSSLTEVVLPAGVYSIQNGAFENCTNLTKVYFLGNEPNNSAGTQFRNCPATLYILPTATGWSTAYAGRPIASVPAIEILSTPNKFQLFSYSQMNSNRALGRSDVTSNPSSYGLYNSTQYANNFTAGKDSILNSPNSNGLYTTSQIQNMAVGDLVLTKNANGSFTLNYDIEKSEDLQTWTTYAPLSLTLTNLPPDKAFIRIASPRTGIGFNH